MKRLEKEILCGACIENKLCFQIEDEIRKYCLAVHDAKYKGRQFYGVTYKNMQLVLRECAKKENKKRKRILDYFY